MQTQINALPNELKAVLVALRKDRKPIRLQGQVRKDLRGLVAQALASGVSQTDLINTALQKLFDQEVK